MLWGISTSSREDAAALAGEYPGITFVADASRSVTDTFAVRHHASWAPPGLAHDDIAYPTSFLVDRSGKIRWVYRSPRIMERASVDELLAAMDSLGWSGYR